MTYTAKSKVRTRESSERIKRLDAIYGRVLELRNFEIQNLNTRNTFILAINLAFIVFSWAYYFVVANWYGCGC